MILNVLADVLKDTLMITSFVMVIMLFIEVLNISTQGAWSRVFSTHPFVQVLVAAVLGMIPGCFGGFAAVSMFTHGIIQFGALMAAMITNVGDEAFVMLVQMPKQTLYLYGILFVLAVLIGSICQFAIKKPLIKPAEKQHFTIHAHEDVSFREMAKDWKKHLQHLTFSRALLVGGLITFILLVALGGFEHGHEMPEVENNLSVASQGGIHLPLEESWFNSIFIVIALLVTIIVVCVNDHFLEHHLWGHVIKKHFLKIFLWTFAALLLIHLLENQVETLNWIDKNRVLVLLLAVLIGLIPESGPHLIFISLYISGNIPFAILLANAMTQDGHSTLPLLAESRKSFLWLKLSKACMAFVIGLVGLLLW